MSRTSKVSQRVYVGRTGRCHRDHRRIGCLRRAAVPEIGRAFQGRRGVQLPVRRAGRSRAIPGAKRHLRHRSSAWISSKQRRSISAAMQKGADLSVARPGGRWHSDLDLHIVPSHRNEQLHLQCGVRPGWIHSHNRH